MGKEPSQMTSRNDISQNPSLPFSEKKNNSAMPKKITSNNTDYRESSARADLSAKERMREGSRQGNSRQEANMQAGYKKGEPTLDKQQTKDSHAADHMAPHPTWNGLEPEQDPDQK